MQFARDEDKRQLRMKGDVARACAGPKHAVATIDVAQRSRPYVQPVYENAVDAEIRRECISIRPIGDDAVCVRRLLTLRVRPRAMMLRDLRRRREPAAWL